MSDKKQTLAEAGPRIQQSVLFNTEGAGVKATSPAFTDLAGNVGVPASLTLNIDHTPPVVNATRTPANAFGWNNSDVTVHFDAADAVSGVVGPPSQEVVFSNDGFFTEQDIDNLRRFVVEEGGGIWFIAGKNYSVADITAMIAVDFMRVTKLATPETWTNLKRWHEQVAARPSAKA